ncbi:MAG: heme o synthase [Thermoplasmata archaeon]
MSGLRTLSAYLELTKPRIILLLVLVALSAYVASAPGAVRLETLLFLALAGALSSAGASAVNHYLDMDIDGIMLRTQKRPLPAGLIRPPEKALLFGLGLLALGVATSYVLINPPTAFFILLGAFVYIVVYTLALKRRHPSNIVIGGFAGSAPALAGSTAAVGLVTVPALLIALLVFLWTPGHFWALGLRNRSDYQRAEVPMLPAVTGDRESALAIIVSTVIVAGFVSTFYFFGGVSLPYLVPALLAGGYLVYTTLRIWGEPKYAWASFKFSGIFLVVTLLAVAAGRFFG